MTRVQSSGLSELQFNDKICLSPVLTEGHLCASFINGRCHPMVTIHPKYSTDSGSLTFPKEFERCVFTVLRPTEELSLDGRGTAVTYGATVRLGIPMNDQVLKIADRDECDDDDEVTAAPTFCFVPRRIPASMRETFRILPKGRVREEGEVVRVGEQIIIESVFCHQYLSVGMAFPPAIFSALPFNACKPEGRPLELCETRAIDAVWEVEAYDIKSLQPECAETAGVPAEFQLRVSDPIVLFHKEKEAFLEGVPDPLSPTNDYQVIFSTVETHKATYSVRDLDQPSNAVWVIESGSIVTGGLILAATFGVPYRIRHLASGKYLCCMPYIRDSSPMPSGRQSQHNQRFKLTLVDSLFDDVNEHIDDTLLSFHPLDTQEECMKAGGYARVEFVRSGSWLHCTKETLSRGQTRHDGTPTQKLAASIAPRMIYEDLFAIHHATDHIAPALARISSIMPLLKAASRIFSNRETYPIWASVSREADDEPSSPTRSVSLRKRPQLPDGADASQLLHTLRGHIIKATPSWGSDRSSSGDTLDTSTHSGTTEGLRQFSIPNITQELPPAAPEVLAAAAVGAAGAFAACAAAPSKDHLDDGTLDANARIYTPMYSSISGDESPALMLPPGVDQLSASFGRSDLSDSMGPDRHMLPVAAIDSQDCERLSAREKFGEGLRLQPITVEQLREQLDEEFSGSLSLRSVTINDAGMEPRPSPSPSRQARSGTLPQGPLSEERQDSPPQPIPEMPDMMDITADGLNITDEFRPFGFMDDDNKSGDDKEDHSSTPSLAPPKAPASPLRAAHINGSPGWHSDEWVGPVPEPRRKTIPSLGDIASHLDAIRQKKLDLEKLKGREYEDDDMNGVGGSPTGGPLGARAQRHGSDLSAVQSEGGITLMVPSLPAGAVDYAAPEQGGRGRQPGFLMSGDPQNDPRRVPSLGTLKGARGYKPAQNVRLADKEDTDFFSDARLIGDPEFGVVERFRSLKHDARKRSLCSLMVAVMQALADLIGFVSELDDIPEDGREHYLPVPVSRAVEEAKYVFMSRVNPVKRQQVILFEQGVHHLVYQIVSGPFKGGGVTTEDISAKTYQTLHIILRLGYRLMMQLVAGYPQASNDVIQYIGFFETQSGHRLNATDTIHAICNNHQEVLSCLKDATVQRFVQLVPTYGRSPSYLNLLSAVCVCCGVGIPRTQHLVCSEVLMLQNQPGKELLHRTRLRDQLEIELLDSTSEENHQMFQSGRGFGGRGFGLESVTSDEEGSVGFSGHSWVPLHTFVTQMGFSSVKYYERQLNLLAALSAGNPECSERVSEIIPQEHILIALESGLVGPKDENFSTNQGDACLGDAVCRSFLHLARVLYLQPDSKIQVSDRLRQKEFERRWKDLLVKDVKENTSLCHYSMGRNDQVCETLKCLLLLIERERFDTDELETFIPYLVRLLDPSTDTEYPNGEDDGDDADLGDVSEPMLLQTMRVGTDTGDASMVSMTTSPRDKSGLGSNGSMCRMASWRRREDNLSWQDKIILALHNQGRGAPLAKHYDQDWNGPVADASSVSVTECKLVACQLLEAALTHYLDNSTSDWAAALDEQVPGTRGSMLPGKYVYTKVLLQTTMYRGCPQLFTLSFRLLCHSLRGEEADPMDVTIQGSFPPSDDDEENTSVVNFAKVIKADLLQNSKAKKVTEVGNAVESQSLSLASHFVNHFNLVATFEETFSVCFLLRVLTYLLESEKDASEEDMVAMQHLLDNFGCTLLMLSLIEAPNEDIVEHALVFGIALLDEGNFQVQTRIMEYFESLREEAFFQCIRTRIQRATAELKELEVAEKLKGTQDHPGATTSSYFDNSSQGRGSVVQMAPEARKYACVTQTLRLLQLFCEGHNNDLQCYIHNQPDNLHTVDLVKESLMVLRAAIRVPTTSYEESLYDVIIQCFNSLTEYCQGPCKENQATLVHGQLAQEVCAVFKMRPDVDTNGRISREQTDEMQNAATIALLSLLEGCEEVRSAHTIMHTRDLMLVIGGALDTCWTNRKREPGEEHDTALELGFNLYIFMETLSSFDTQHILLDNSFFMKNHRGFKYFQAMTGRIEIAAKDNRLQRVYFRIPELCLNLSKNTKQHILWSVDRDTPNARIVSYFSKADDALYEMRYNDQLFSSKALIKGRALLSDDTEFADKALGILCIIGFYVNRHAMDLHDLIVYNSVLLVLCYSFMMDSNMTGSFMSSLVFYFFAVLQFLCTLVKAAHQAIAEGPILVHKAMKQQAKGNWSRPKLSAEDLMALRRDDPTGSDDEDGGLPRKDSMRGASGKIGAFPLGDKLLPRLGSNPDITEENSLSRHASQASLNSNGVFSEGVGAARLGLSGYEAAPSRAHSLRTTSTIRAAPATAIAEEITRATSFRATSSDAIPVAAAPSNVSRVASNLRTAAAAAGEAPPQSSTADGTPPYAPLLGGGHETRLGRVIRKSSQIMGPGWRGSSAAGARTDDGASTASPQPDSPAPTKSPVTPNTTTNTASPATTQPGTGNTSKIKQRRPTPIPTDIEGYVDIPGSQWVDRGVVETGTPKAAPAKAPAPPPDPLTLSGLSQVVTEGETVSPTLNASAQSLAVSPVTPRRRGRGYTDIHQPRHVRDATDSLTPDIDKAVSGDRLDRSIDRLDRPKEQRGMPRSPRTPAQSSPQGGRRGRTRGSSFSVLMDQDETNDANSILTNAANKAKLGLSGGVRAARSPVTTESPASPRQMPARKKKEDDAKAKDALAASQKGRPALTKSQSSELPVHVLGAVGIQAAATGVVSREPSSMSASATPVTGAMPAQQTTPPPVGVATTVVTEDEGSEDFSEEDDDDSLLSRETFHVARAVASCLIRDGNFVGHFLMVMFSGFGLFVSPLFFTPQLFSMIANSPILQSVIRSITKNGKSLLLTGFLAVIIVFHFAVGGHLFFKDAYQNADVAAKTIFRTFVHTLLNGIASGGISSLMHPPDFDHDGDGSLDAWYGLRVAFDFSFFVIVIVILLNIIFGIIIDTFAELRAEKQKIEEEIRTKCFICGIESSEFDRHASGFEHHIKRDHNMWAYIYFIHHLRTKEESEFTGQESYVWNKMKMTDLSFFPCNRAICFQNKEGDDAGEDAAAEGAGARTGAALEGKVTELWTEQKALLKKTDGMDRRLREMGNIMNVVADSLRRVTAGSGVQDDALGMSSFNARMGQRQSLSLKRTNSIRETGTPLTVDGSPYNARVGNNSVVATPLGSTPMHMPGHISRSASICSQFGTHLGTTVSHLQEGRTGSY